MTIGGKDFETEERSIDQHELLFYEENPRIYSLIQSDEGAVTQQGIQDALSNMEHVKQLRVSIEQNGGLTDPLVVAIREGQHVVIEGNSRLAAYRLLAKKEPHKWHTIRCSVLPNDVGGKDIFTLLGQLHLVGRKDWSVFEQAAFLYRECAESSIEPDTLAKSVGLPTSTVKQYLRVYRFMREHDDLRPDKWSHYDEYLKSNAIKKYRETIPAFDEAFVRMVKSGEIKQAVDVRNVFAFIAKGKDKTATRLMKEIVERKTSLYDAYDEYDSLGKTGGAFQKIKKFRETIADKEFRKKIESEISSSPAMVFEIKKTLSLLERLLKELQKIT